MEELPTTEREKLLAAFVERIKNFVEWVRKNPSHANKIGRRIQRFVGIALIFLGCSTGHLYFDLILNGTRTQGTIVDFKYRSWKTQSSNGIIGLTFAFMPIVEFHVAEKSYRFENWWGSRSTAGKNTQVPIFYNSENPSVAMIDKGVLNWIPWGPFFAVGVFLILVSIFGKGLYRTTLDPDGSIRPSCRRNSLD